MKKIINKTCLLIFLLEFVSIVLVAQIPQMITGAIQDEKGEPLAYVNIGIVGTTIGTVSEEDGKFQLYLSSSNTINDSLRVSIIGYKSQSFSLKTIESPLNIQLEEDIIDLAEIIVKPQFKKSKIKGFQKVKGKRSVNFSIKGKPRQNLGAELGKLFKTKNKTTQIEAFNFYIRTNNFDSVKFRVLIYQANQKMPDKYLVKDDIIINIKDKKTGWINVDLSPYNIITNNDFIITLQWIDASENGSYLAIPIKWPVLGSHHYYKYGSQAKWNHYKMMSTVMNVRLAYD